MVSTPAINIPITAIRDPIILRQYWSLIKRFLTLSPPPSWLPSLVQPADWFVVKLSGIFILCAIVVLLTSNIQYPKGGDYV